MTKTIQHKGFGKWRVLEDDHIIAEGLTKAEAQQMAGLPVDAEAPAAPLAEPTMTEEGAIPLVGADGKPLTQMQRRRIYEKSMEAAQKAASSDIDKVIEGVLLLKWDADTVNGLMKVIGPVLKAGPEGLRREIRRNMARSIPAQAAA